MLIKSLIKKSFFTALIIFSPIVFGQLQFNSIDRNLNESSEKNKSYQISSLARSTAVDIILPLKSGSGSGVLIEKKGSLYTVLTAFHLFVDVDLEIPFTIRTADYSFYKAKKGCISTIVVLLIFLFTKIVFYT